MPFRYRLQSVLRLRRSLEHQEEQRLFALAAIVNRLRAELGRRQALDLSARRAALAEMEELSGFSSGAQLQFRARCDAASQAVIERLKTQLQEAERKRLEQLAVYQGARQQREIFEGLRDHQKEVYDRELARHEQQANDEAFLLRSFPAPSQD